MLDAKLIFSEDQNTAHADVVSTNVIDVGAYETALGEEEHLRLVCAVAIAYNDDNAADDSTLHIVLQDCATVGGTYKTIAASKAYTAPEMPIGKLWDIGIPAVHKRYLRLNYDYATGTGDFDDVGRMNAHIIAR
jgi:hypothetical protein